MRLAEDDLRRTGGGAGTRDHPKREARIEFVEGRGDGCGSVSPAEGGEAMDAVFGTEETVWIKDWTCMELWGMWR